MTTSDVQTESAPPEQAVQLTALTPPTQPHSRWSIVRDLVALQLKLILGNLHNFMLMPVCLFAAALDILFKNRRDEAWLYKTLAWGRHLDEMIGLYSSLNTQDGEAHNPPERYSVDALLARVEDAARREYEKGGTAASVKNAVDAAVERATAKAGVHKDRVREALDRAAEKLRSKT